jgi:hypothetical protein
MASTNPKTDIIQSAVQPSSSRPWLDLFYTYCNTSHGNFAFYISCKSTPPPQQNSGVCTADIFQDQFQPCCDIYAAVSWQELKIFKCMWIAEGSTTDRAGLLFA